MFVDVLGAGMKSIREYFLRKHFSIHKGKHTLQVVDVVAIGATGGSLTLVKTPGSGFGEDRYAS